MNYESGGAMSDSGSFAIGAFGALAGAVAAPLANGSAAKAWAGLSGATNGIQMSLEETFSASVSTKRRAKVYDTVKLGETAYKGAASDDERVTSALVMAAKCSMASSVADEDALKRLNQ